MFVQKCSSSHFTCNMWLFLDFHFFHFYLLKCVWLPWPHSRTFWRNSFLPLDGSVPVFPKYLDSEELNVHAAKMVLQPFYFCVFVMTIQWLDVNIATDFHRSVFFLSIIRQVVNTHICIFIVKSWLWVINKNPNLYIWILKKNVQFVCTSFVFGLFNLRTIL